MNRDEYYIKFIKLINYKKSLEKELKEIDLEIEQLEKEQGFKSKG